VVIPISVALLITNIFKCIRWNPT